MPDPILEHVVARLAAMGDFTREDAIAAEYDGASYALVLRDRRTGRERRVRWTEEEGELPGGEQRHYSIRFTHAARAEMAARGLDPAETERWIRRDVAGSGARDPMDIVFHTVPLTPEHSYDIANSWFVAPAWDEEDILVVDLSLAEAVEVPTKEAPGQSPKKLIWPKAFSEDGA
ncbi:MAG TPA: hypothetical protein VEH84_02645 [Alphaproteobacteria bacterium]|nr:hypothetical protein [Alphaproteobacteria bacterium]